jgi:hypothetical protein
MGLIQNQGIMSYLRAKQGRVSWGVYSRATARAAARLLQGDRCTHFISVSAYTFLFQFISHIFHLHRGAQHAMASKTMAPQAGRLADARPARVNALRAVPVMGRRAGRRSTVQVAAAVKYDYNTKVFTKELVKFADTEEYIYRQVAVAHCARNCFLNDKGDLGAR